MDKIIKILLVLFVLLAMPAFAKAASLSSGNYMLTDQISYGGGTNDSNNYEIFGFLTDDNGIAFWPTFISTSAQNASKVTTPADTIIIAKDNEVSMPSTVSVKPLSEVEILLTTKVLGDISIGEIAEGFNVPLLETTVGLTFSILLISQLVNIGLLAPLANIWGWFLSLFAGGKKKEQFGKVYDAETGKPIAFAIVQLFDQEFGKLLSTQSTDSVGRFSIQAKPGKYILKAVKSNYIFPSKITAKDYHGAEFSVTEEAMINYEIPLDPNVPVLAHRINIAQNVISILYFIRIPVMILGSVMSMVVLYSQFSIWNAVIVGLYALAWLIELYRLRQVRPYGLTMDKIGSEHLDLVILRLFDENNKLLSTKVSDSEGKYSFLTNPGDYNLWAIRQGYEQYKSDPLKFAKSGMVNLDVYLSKEK